MPSLRLVPSLRRTLGPLGASLLMACASVQNRYVATPIGTSGQPTPQPVTASGLVVSGEELTQYSSDFFGLIEVTFENTTNEWLHVERLTLDFGDPERNEGVLLPEGADLAAWHQATVHRNEIRDTNAASALGALLALGTVVAIAGRASGERGIETVGKSIVLGTATAAVIDEQGARADSAEHRRMLTQTHLLAVPFAIPPGLFAKKWVLINTRSRMTPCIASMLIDYDVERGGERVLLRFRRRGHGHSNWQRYTCAARIDHRARSALSDEPLRRSRARVRSAARSNPAARSSTRRARRSNGREFILDEILSSEVNPAARSRRALAAARPPR